MPTPQPDANGLRAPRSGLLRQIGDLADWTDDHGPTLSASLRIVAVEQDAHDALADLAAALDALDGARIARALGRLADAGELARHLSRKVAP